MVKIVIVAGQQLFPVATGGQLRTAGFAQALARQGYNVTVYSLTGRRADYVSSRFLAGRRQEAIEDRLIEITHLGFWRGIAHYLSRAVRYPRFLQYYALARGWIPKELRTLLSEADAVIADGSFIPRVPEYPATQPWYLLSHQLEFKLLEQQYGVAHRYTQRLKRFEEKAAQQYHEIFSVAEADQEFFRKEDIRKLIDAPILRCGVDPLRYQRDPVTRARVREELGFATNDTVFLFTGSAWLPNAQAVSFLREFARRNHDVLRKLRIYFLIVGSVEKASSRDGRAVITGRVPEIFPYFCAADVGLNPIDTGAGANVKLFEYVAAKLPVMSTTFGARGSSLVEGIDYVGFNRENFLDVLHSVVARRSDGDWELLGEEVWSRHKNQFDITEIVRSTLILAPDFPQIPYQRLPES